MRRVRRGKLVNVTPHRRAALLESRRGRSDFLAAVASRGLRISALNASGNQLHPRDGRRNDKMVRDVIRLAGEFGVTTIVLMSGLPGGTPTDQMPNWITTSWPPETTEMLNYQWNDVAIPYWHDLAAFAAANGVTRLAIEMHGNQIVFSVPGVLRLREEIGEIVGANLDPSHLIWMGADPLKAVERARLRRSSTCTRRTRASKIVRPCAHASSR